MLMYYDKSKIIDKLKTVNVDLSKLSNAVNNYLVKRLCMINHSLSCIPLKLANLF